MSEFFLLFTGKHSTFYNFFYNIWRFRCPFCIGLATHIIIRKEVRQCVCVTMFCVLTRPLSVKPQNFAERNYGCIYPIRAIFYNFFCMIKKHNEHCKTAWKVVRTESRKTQILLVFRSAHQLIYAKYDRKKCLIKFRLLNFLAVQFVKYNINLNYSKN